jgi:hypothetical protein
MPDPHHRLNTDRKEVEVEVDGTWYTGEVRSWNQDEDDGSWSAIVTWCREPGEMLIDRFPAALVRELHR